MDTFPIPIHRLDRLSDLIFAVAMTLIALTFDSTAHAIEFQYPAVAIA